MRSLEEMKAARGGYCFECGNRLVPEDKDHSFCNTCWNKMLAHPFEPSYDDNCDTCGEPKDAEIHQRYQAEEE